MRSDQIRSDEIKAVMSLYFLSNIESNDVRDIVDRSRNRNIRKGVTDHYALS